MKRLIILAIFLINSASVLAQSADTNASQKPIVAPDKEEDFYRMFTLPVPENIILEVGGMAAMPDGDLAVCTRRGEVWIVSNPYVTGFERPVFRRFAYGLHEPLGLAYKDGDIYVTQRSEVTHLIDVDKDGQADSYDKIYSWPLSG